MIVEILNDECRTGKIVVKRWSRYLLIANLIKKIISCIIMIQMSLKYVAQIFLLKMFNPVIKSQEEIQSKNLV